MVGVIVNKKARNFEIIETFEAGIVLLGPEVKAIRSGNVNINDAFIKYKNGGIFLVNMKVDPINPNSFFEKFNSLRERKLLLKKSEIKRLIGKLQTKGLTAIPTKLYHRKRWIKIEIAIVKHKTKYDKREEIKQKEIDRKIQEILKRKGIR